MSLVGALAASTDVADLDNWLGLALGAAAIVYLFVVLARPDRF